MLPTRTSLTRPAGAHRVCRSQKHKPNIPLQFCSYMPHGHCSFVALPDARANMSATLQSCSSTELAVVPAMFGAKTFLAEMLATADCKGLFLPSCRSCRETEGEPSGLRMLVCHGRGPLSERKGRRAFNPTEKTLVPEQCVFFMCAFYINTNKYCNP